ncbi:hypothetical protein PIB30_076845 [Stylosanthes scabra]|uniref:Uncharacterized protein n=1 Tax=Stylosanthes scabra TaxID=79078 RepID=A0ABU6YR57_9FABA|nr:hypothetical protein [Stylosanthes scabra]
MEIEEPNLENENIRSLGEQGSKEDAGMEEIRIDVEAETYKGLRMRTEQWEHQKSKCKPRKEEQKSLKVKDKEEATDDTTTQRQIKKYKPRQCQEYIVELPEDLDEDDVRSQNPLEIETT